MKVVRRSDGVSADLRHLFNDAVYVVTPQAYLHGLALAGHARLVNLSRRTPQ